MAEETAMQRAASWPAQVKDYFERASTRNAARHLASPGSRFARPRLVVIVAVFAFAAYFFVVDAVVNAGDHKVVQYVYEVEGDGCQMK